MPLGSRPQTPGIPRPPGPKRAGDRPLRFVPIGSVLARGATDADGDEATEAITSGHGILKFQEDSTDIIGRMVKDATSILETPQSAEATQSDIGMLPDGELTEAQALAIIEQGREAIIFALLTLAKERAELARQ